MTDYPHIIFGCNCNTQCVCTLCGLKAIDCKYAGCKDCDKVIGYKGCQYK